MKPVFADRLLEATRSRNSVLCAGIDPHTPPALFHGKGLAPVKAVGDWLFALLPILVRHVGVIKPQLALFERLGAEGMTLLADFTKAATAEGLLVIMDGKRGDIASSATAYAEAYLGEDAPFPAHALTINPYLGTDCVTSFAQIAAKKGGGIFVLVRTSNLDSTHPQEIICQDGRAVYLHVAERLIPHTESLMGTSGFSSCGIVIGATQPEAARQLRAMLPTALFLIPGYGAQGASASDAMAGLVDGKEGKEGGVVNSSRQLLQNQDAQTAATLADWQGAVANAITRTISDLRG